MDTTIAASTIATMSWLFLTRESVRQAPPYDSAQPWSRERELSLYQHYGRSGYWAGSAVLEPLI